MTQFVSRSRKLLVGSLAAAGLAVGASPASAFLYVIDFQTSAQHGQIDFVAPDYMNAPPHGLPGTITGLYTILSVVTTTGSNFNNSGIPQRVVSIEPIGGFTNAFGHKNDNTLLTFTNSNNTTPPSSSGSPYTSLGSPLAASRSRSGMARSSICSLSRRRGGRIRVPRPSRSSHLTSIST